MLKREFIAKVTDALRDSGVRKQVSLPKRAFTITDSDGNTSTFKVKSEDKRVLYTSEDVRRIIDACFIIVEDAMRNGEEITFTGYGTLGPHLRAARRTRQPGTDTWFEIPARYVPSFKYGNILRMAALAYTMNTEEREKYLQNMPQPEDDEDYSEDD